jgi:UDP-N-acetylglucosamine 2-epimerase
MRAGGIGPVLRRPYLVVLQHPSTTTPDDYAHAAQHMRETVDAIVALDRPTCLFWPGADPGSEAAAKVIRVAREERRLRHDRVHLFRNVPPMMFLRLVAHADCLIGNSSAGIRECSYLGTPVVNIGNRQDRRERATNVLDVEPVCSSIIAAVNKQSVRYYSSSKLYGDGKAGSRIAEVLATAPLTAHKGFCDVRFST